ncbi:carbohydrate ABC transporter permease [Trichococcus sp.]|uniref:carbohydrate ABC transporter permease n=1 Tax=Trichococcus sp. TaxID=1985464 RepID=UPI003C7EB27C
MIKSKFNMGMLTQRVFVFGMGAIFLFPFLISILLSLKTKVETSKDVLGLPEKLNFQNYIDAMEQANILGSMFNSIVVTVFSVLIVIVVASSAGYAIARNYSSRLYRGYESLLMAAMMIPFQTLMIPVYKMLRNLELLNTLPGAIIMIAGINMPFAIMMFVGFVRTIPIELEEAAMLEGCGKFKLFTHIIFPILKPITVTIGVLDALWAWNEFNISLIVLQKDAVKTIPMQQYVFFSQHSANYNMAFAAAVISMVPIIIFFLFAQKHIVAGMTSGAVKG